jgi:hypothetical protein
MMTFTPIFFFGRSGSTITYKLLEQHPEIFSLNEVYMNLRGKDRIFDLNTKDFLRLHVVDKVKEANSRKPHCVFQCLSYDPESFMNTPIDFDVFFKFINDTFGKMIYFRRKNLLKQAVSFERATIEDLWHLDKNALYENKSIEFHPLMRKNMFHFKSYLNNTSRRYYTDYVNDDNFNTLMLRDYLSIHTAKQDKILQIARNNIPNLLEIVYEDHVELDPIHAANMITDFLKVPRFNDYDLLLSKKSKGLKHDLINFEEIKEHLKNTPFDWMTE